MSNQQKKDYPEITDQPLITDEKFHQSELKTEAPAFEEAKPMKVQAQQHQQMQGNQGYMPPPQQYAPPPPPGMQNPMNMQQNQMQQNQMQQNQMQQQQMQPQQQQIMQPNPMNQGNQYMTPQQYPQPQQPVYQHNVYNPPPPPPIIVAGAPTIMAIEVGAGGIYCPICLRNTPTLTTKSAGLTTYIWCLILLFLTGFFCCIPFCIDSCQDTTMLCTTCRNPKSRIPASFI